MRFAFAFLSLLLSGPVLAETQICARECVEGDCQNGPGLQVYANCDRYKGEFQKGQREGHGEYQFANGDTYTGTFHAGRRSGQGLYRFKKQNGEATQFESSMDSRGNGRGLLRIGASITECTITRFVTECGQTGRMILSEKMEPIGLVLYSGPGSSLTRGTQSLPVKPGDAVRPGDSLQSGRENLDMQLTGQVALRMKPDTSLNVGRDSAERRLSLEKGEVIVKFEKDTGGISLRAPAAEVEAEGSTLSVRTTAQETDVKVFELRQGKVLVSPALPELEGKTRREIEADPELKKADERRASLARPIAPSSSTRVAAVSDSANAKPVESQPFVPTRRETMETRALVTADERSLQNAAERPGDFQSRQILLDSYRANSQTALSSIEKDLEGIVLTSDKEIMQQYGLVENLVMRNGQTVQGATVTQAGDTLVVHAVRRVLRVRTIELLYIDYIQKEDLP